jgi:hypothetical protein
MSDTCTPRRCCNFRDEDENPDVEAVPIKKGALALAEESGISMSGEYFDGYYLLYLLFLFSYHCDVAVSYNALIFRVYNDNGHETCVDAEAFR